MQRYIDWKTVSQINREMIDPIEMARKISEVKADPIWVCAETKTKYSDWNVENKKVYRVDENRKYIYLNVCDNTLPDDEFKYKVWFCHMYKTKETIEKAKELGIRGFQCRSKILKSFKEHNEGLSMVKAFGTTSSDEFRYLVPKPVYYLTPNKRNYFTNIDDAQYIDVSSMYPACACGKLPTTKGMIRIEGRVEPNEEYPFAFYLKSHHCAEYGVFDTRDYLKLRKEYYMWQCFTDNKKAIYDNIEDEDEITVLMPASKYELTGVFEEIYAKKCAGDPLAKAIANKGIGTFHRAPNEKKHEVLRDYYHLAAIILGRANAKMHAMIHKIEYEKGYEVLSCIVDSIIYRGDKNFGISEKVLGEFYDEFSVNKEQNKGIIIRMTDCINKYVVADKEDPKKILKYVLSGIPTSEQHIEKLEDIDKYFKKGAN